MTVLPRILDAKRAEVSRARRRLPAAALRELVADAGPVRDFAMALRQPSSPRVIAEVKRASPTRGVLRPSDPVSDWEPEQLARAYVDGGAAALSVLTDVRFFWGHADALGACREAVDLPVLRKEFILDPYQVDESRWLGADAVLLIVRALEQATLHACAERVVELGMTPLVEIHADDELDAALAVPGAILGINHRDLDTLEIDLERSVRLRQRIPDDRIVVAESGLSAPEQLAELTAAGIDAFLIGERIASADDPAAELRRLRAP